MDPYQADEYTGGSGGQPSGLPLNPEEYPDFRLMFHPKRWQFFQDSEGGGEWLPALGKLVLVPGIQCVDKDGGTSLAFAEREDRGWTVLRASSDLRAYISQYAGRPRASGRVPTIYLERWMHPRMVAGEVKVKYDRDEHVAFLRALVASGRCPRVEDEVVELLRGRVQDELDRDSGESVSDGKAARRAAAASLRLAAMDAASTPATLPAARPARPAKSAP